VLRYAATMGSAGIEPLGGVPIMAAKLVVKTALETLEVQLEPGKEYFIGRSHEANVLVRDPQVSRRHCQIVAGADGQWTLTDLGSGNGTFVGKMRVTEHPLRHGDVVRVGKSTVEFHQDEGEHPAAAAAQPQEVRLAEPAPARQEAGAPEPVTVPRGARAAEPPSDDIPVLSPAGETPAPPAARPAPAAAPVFPPAGPPPKAQAPSPAAAAPIFPPIGQAAPGLAAAAPVFPSIGQPPRAAAPKPFAAAAAAPTASAPWRRMGKKFSPAAFGIVILLFLLPFMHISCAGERVATLNGFEMAFGSSKTEVDAVSLLALIAAATGLGLSFLPSERSALAPAIAALVGFVLLVLRLASYRSASEEGMSVEAGFGIVLALLVFLAAAGFNGFLFFTRKKGGG